MTDNTPPSSAGVTTPPEQESRRQRSTIYIVVAVAFALLLVIALLVRTGRENNAEAQHKADQLISALQSRGVQRLPTTDQIAEVLGTNGGPTCENPAKALGRSSLFAALANGAGGPGARPVIADSLFIQGQLLIIQIYCPGQLNEFRNMIKDLKFERTVNS